MEDSKREAMLARNKAALARAEAKKADRPTTKTAKKKETK